MPCARADSDILLSALDLTKATQGWGKPGVNRSVDGKPLTLNGHIYPTGFGTHAPGQLIVDLNGSAKRFHATVGVDDEVGGIGRGNAEFQVLGAQHTLLFDSGVMRQGDPARVIRVNLTGVKRITLRVTTAGGKFDYCHADWADATFEVESGANSIRTISAGSSEQDPIVSTAAEPRSPKIRGPKITGVRPATPFLFTIPVTGDRPMRFTAKGLPPGLRLDADTGLMAGIAPKLGTYLVTVSAKNAVGLDTSVLRIESGTNLSLTPPVGWNSYDAYDDTVTEADVLANARYIAENLRAVGWQYVVVDYRWYDPSHAPAAIRVNNGLAMDAYGRMLPAPNKFPSSAGGVGFKRLSDEIHAMGLKFGIHIMRGIPRAAVDANLKIEGSPYFAGEAGNPQDKCPWGNQYANDMYGVRSPTAAGQAYYDSLFRLYASWGLDFVKVDDISKPYRTDEIAAIRRAIDKCGRSIVLSLSPGATPIEQGAVVSKVANQWRMADDFWDRWPELNAMFDLGYEWRGFSGPGHWPDADMLPLGQLSLTGFIGPKRMTEFTRNEQVSLMSFWSLLPAPLIMSGNLPSNDPWTLALLSNPEVLAVDQDALGAAANRIVKKGGLEVWSKTLADGSIAVGVFNRGDFETDSVTVSARDLGVGPTWCVRDLWQRKEIGAFGIEYHLEAVPHGANLLLIHKAER